MRFDVEATYPGKVRVGQRPLGSVKLILISLGGHLIPEYLVTVSFLLFLSSLFLGFRDAGGRAPLSLELSVALTASLEGSTNGLCVLW